MKISYAATFDLQKPESWARRHLGLYRAGARIAQALENEGIELESLGVLHRKNSVVNKFKWLAYQKLFKQDFGSWADPAVSRHYARQLENQLANSESDILLCLENAIPLAMTEPDRPMVLWTDTTLGSLVDFYPHMSSLCAETRRNLLRMEKSVLDKCALLVVNSSWAARRAQEIYGISADKIEVIPRVANRTQRLPVEDIQRAIEQRGTDVCRLLFMGVDWRRKGGNTALGVAKLLNETGIRAELHIVGCKPAIDFPDFVQLHGFVDRSTAQGRAHMAQLLQSTHFLLYPTQADALGMVLSEAGAYGVPALATDVGGISDLVKADVTGKTFAVGSNWQEYCQFVSTYLANPGRYRDLARSTLDFYCEYASERAVGQRAKSAFKAILER
ncbi:MAG: glycosyltransferase family 4 protein [Cyanobacteria bacterium J06634_6]